MQQATGVSGYFNHSLVICDAGSCGFVSQRHKDPTCEKQELDGCVCQINVRDNIRRSIIYINANERNGGSGCQYDQ
jgi:hypothetical protein